MTRRRHLRTLFETPVQPRLVKPEAPEVYDAVLRARKCGWRVFRAGRDRHYVRKPWGWAGKVSTAALLADFPPRT